MHEAFALHHSRVQPIKDAEQLVRVATEQGSGEDHGAVARRRERAQGVSLSRICALQFVNFIRDAVVEKAVEIATDELDWRNPMNLGVVRLPEWTVQRPARFLILRRQYLAVLHLAKIAAPELVVSTEDWPSGVRVHDHSQVRAALRGSEAMSPEVAKLGPLPRDDKDAGRLDLNRPPRLRRAVILGEANVAECRAESFADDAPIPHTELVDSCESVRCGTIADAVDDENPNARSRGDALARPFLDQLRGDHSKRIESSPSGVRKDAP